MSGQDPCRDETAPFNCTDGYVGDGVGAGVGAGDGDGLGAGVGVGVGDGDGFGAGAGVGLGVGAGGGGGGGGAAACEMPSELPLTVIVAERGAVAAFAATTIVSEASPCPVFGLTCTHAVSVVTLHVQSRVVEMVAVAEMPENGTELGIPVTLG